MGSKNAVDELLQKAVKAGATMTDKPHDRHLGRLLPGYFKDLDGHLWDSCGIPRIEEIDDL